MVGEPDKKTFYVGLYRLDKTVLGKASHTLTTLNKLFPDISEEITACNNTVLKLKDLLNTYGWEIYKPKEIITPKVITPTIKTLTKKERKAQELKELTEKTDKYNAKQKANQLAEINKIKASITNPEVVIEAEPVKISLVEVDQEVLEKALAEEEERQAKIEKIKAQLLELNIEEEVI